VKSRSGGPASFSLPETSKNNCGFEAISLALLRLPRERGVDQKLGEVSKTLAKSADHEGLNELERGELHELASELLACPDELNELRELVTSALVNTALPLEPAIRDLVRSLLADASTPTGARFALLVRLLRLRGGGGGVHATERQPPGLRPAWKEAGPAAGRRRCENGRPSGERRGASCAPRPARLPRSLLLFTCAAPPNGPQRIRLGPMAAYAPFTGVYRHPRARPLAVELVLVKGFEHRGGRLDDQAALADTERSERRPRVKAARTRVGQGTWT
jgi:hypothetical protein